MNFASPAWLPAGLLSILALIWLWRRYDARQHAALAKFVSAHLRLQLTRSISAGRRRLQRGVFHSLVDLQAAINRYLGEHNRQPKPFVWTADPDRIIEKVNRGYQAIASDH